jgi:hypothetical protein
MRTNIHRLGGPTMTLVFAGVVKTKTNIVFWWISACFIYLVFIPPAAAALIVRLTNADIYAIVRCISVDIQTDGQRWEPSSSRCYWWLQIFVVFEIPRHACASLQVIVMMLVISFGCSTLIVPRHYILCTIALHESETDRTLCWVSHFAWTAIKIISFLQDSIGL